MIESTRRPVRDLLALLAILSCFAIVFRRILFSGYTIWLWDVAYLNLPFRHALALALHSGDFGSLLWTREIYGGYPLFADGQGGFLYLPNLFAYRLLDAFHAHAALTIFHYTLAGVGMYLLARYLGASPWGALVGSFSYPLGGAYVGALYYTSMISTASWAPMLLLAMEWSYRGRSLRRATVAGAIWATQILAGHVQLAAVTLVGVSIYALFRPLAGRPRQRDFLMTVGVICCVVAAGVGLAAMQILPTLQLRDESVRTGLSYDFLTSGSVPPGSLVTLIAPLFFLDPVAATDWDRFGSDVWIYAGVVSLVLAVVAIIAPDRRKWLPLLAMTLGALALSFGRYLPLYSLLLLVPPFHGFRFPSRFAFIFDLGVGLLAAHGFDSWIQYPPPSRSFGHAMKGLGVACAAASLAWASYLAIASGLAFPASTEWIQTNLVGAIGNPALPKEVLRADLAGTVDYHRPWVVLPFVVLSLVGLGLIHGRSSHSRRWATGIVLTIASALEFFTFSNLILPMAQLPLAQASVVPDIVRSLPGDAYQTRVASSDGIGPALDLLRPDILMLYDLPALQGFSPLDPRRHDLFFSVLASYAGSPELARLLGASGVKYAIYSPGAYDAHSRHPFAVHPLGPDGPPSPFVGPGFVPIWQGREGVAYVNEQALPRAFVVNHVIRAASPNAAAQVMSQPQFDPRVQAVVEGGSEHFASSSTLKSRVTWLRDDPLDEEMTVTLDQPGLLVVADSYDLNWGVQVDGEPRAILPANVMFRGVALAAGSHDVHFSYSTRMVATGAMVSGATLLLVLAIALVHHLPRSGRPRAGVHGSRVGGTSC